jgi:hypothetical protein
MLTPAKYLLTGLLLGAATAALAGDIDRLPGNSADYYKVIVPAEPEMKWKRVPWMTRLDEAMKVAAREKRPVCIWVVDNEPLDRC